VPLSALLYGLLLPSGNDAAIALAQHVARTQPRFVSMMNTRARSLGLSCTHLTTVSGIADRPGRAAAQRGLCEVRASLLSRLPANRCVELVQSGNPHLRSPSTIY
jgi:serine-type D-Ala-D-Ala carboxypeptidase (penicillin-binding protein 5/6)